MKSKITVIAVGVLILLNVVLSLYSLNTKGSIVNRIVYFGERTASSAAPTSEPKKSIVKPSVLLQIPVVGQLPELQRGCEVTSLAMLLSHAGVKADKMVLAQQIRKDPTRFSRVNGVVHFGNPNDGFVGDIYTFKKSGLGVYHKPIAELAEKYLPGRVYDFSGSSFDRVIQQLSSGKPVWVITNSTYRYLPEAHWRTWQTPSGKIKVTYFEHCVLLTGFDKQYVYFNDPLTMGKNIKVSRADFQKSWEQIGNQAISYK
jgi:uncharacterized protein YvpB